MRAQVDATLAMARFFVDEARKSRHAAMSREQESDLLIYNWAPEYTGKVLRRVEGPASSSQDEVVSVNPYSVLRMAFMLNILNDLLLLEADHSNDGI